MYLITGVMASCFSCLKLPWSIQSFAFPQKIELENSFREHDRIIMRNTQKAGIALLKNHRVIHIRTSIFIRVCRVIPLKTSHNCIVFLGIIFMRGAHSWS
jgi:hypothetical protein